MRTLYKLNFSISISALLLLCTGLILSSEPLQLRRIDARITIDGQLTEPIWKKIPALPVIMHQPVFGIAPTEKTEIFVVYDRDYLYVGANLYDSQPDKIQATSLRRDGGDASNDWFGIILDTFNDKENGLAFFTTPAGLRLDMAILNDGEGDDMMNESWSTFWDVATKVANEGWFVEMKIPFSSLRFQNEGDSVKMGLISWRWIARSEETIIFPDIPQDYGFAALFKPSQAKEVVFHSVYPKNPFYITPYLLGGFGNIYELNDKSTAYSSDEKKVHEMGVDAKFSLASNLTLDLSVNTDFAQVEADDEQINLTRFSLFFPEKRMFFQERSSNFEFNFDDNNRLFYSRRIGISAGNQVPIYGGARLVGRIGKWDIGLLSMQTAPYEEHTSENFSIMRIRKQVFNPYSYLGSIVTGKIGTDGSYSSAYGMDGIFRLFGDDYLTLKWAQTFCDSCTNNSISLDPARIRMQWEKRTVKGFNYDFSADRAGIDYNPAMGFELRENYTRLSGTARYGWIAGDKSKVLRHRLFGSGMIVYRNPDYSVESMERSAGWYIILKRGHFASIEADNLYESLRDTFQLAENVYIPPGQYSFNQVNFQFYTPSSGLIWLTTELHVGSFYDGNRYSTLLEPYWNIPPHIQLAATYQFDYIEFQDRNQNLRAHLGRLHLVYMYDTKLSFSGFIQYNNMVQAFVSNLRLRYNISEGHDFYIVYDETANINRFRETPYLPKYNNRTVLIKYLYTFRQ